MKKNYFIFYLGKGLLLKNRVLCVVEHKNNVPNTTDLIVYTISSKHELCFNNQKLLQFCKFQQLVLNEICESPTWSLPWWKLAHSRFAGSRPTSPESSSILRYLSLLFFYRLNQHLLLVANKNNHKSYNSDTFQVNSNWLTYMSSTKDNFLRQEQIQAFDNEIHINTSPSAAISI